MTGGHNETGFGYYRKLEELQKYIQCEFNKTRAFLSHRTFKLI